MLWQHLQVKQICVYLELADLPKMINTKLDQGEDRLTQTLVFPKFSYIYIQKYMVPKPFKKYYDGKCSHSTCQRQSKTITQIRPMTKTKARERLKAKGSNFGTYTYK